MITISPTSLFIWKKMNLCWSLCGLLEYFHEKNSLDITHANHMTMTTSGQIWSWPDYCKTKENVYILLSTCQ